MGVMVSCCLMISSRFGLLVLCCVVRLVCRLIGVIGVGG